MLMGVYYKKVVYDKKINVRNVSISAVFVAFIIALIVVFIGPMLFNFFSISVDSFRIAGGIVLLLLGLDTIRPKKEEEQSPGNVDNLISIIATPMLTGPATISYITIKSIEVGKMTLLINIIITFLIVGIIFWLFASYISKINARLINIISRVLGLFLTAVAIEMIAKGVTGVISAAV
jgi:multiple antibiotic resistance protein